MDDFFRVTFIKKNGSIRILNGRLGCKKYVKGTGKPINKALSYMKIFDVQNDGWRMVNLDTIINLKVNGKEYYV